MSAKRFSSLDLSIPYNLTHTYRFSHTPVDTQNGAGVRQHAGGTRGDHTVKWTGPFSLPPYLFLERLSGHCNFNPGPPHVLPQALSLSPHSLTSSAPQPYCYPQQRLSIWLVLASKQKLFLNHKLFKCCRDVKVLADSRYQESQKS